METLSIRLNIADRVYPLKVPVAEEESVREAAKIINEKSKAYSQAYQVKDHQDTLAMVALEFASEITAGKNNKSTGNEKAQEILNLLIQKIEPLIG